MLACLSGAVLAATPDGPLGDFEHHADIGSPSLMGNATYNAATQEYAFTAGGYNVWFKRDEMHFGWRRFKGDFIVQARIRFLGEGVDPHRKAGIMLRNSLDEDAIYVDGAVHGDGLTSLQYRKNTGGETAQIEITQAKGADVLQLERRGSRFIVSAARFGEPFRVVETSEIAIDDDAYLGLFLSSHRADAIERAVFDNVRVIRPAEPGFQPYRDYIGSRLELLNVATGQREQVYQSRVPFEAPNWLPDGTSLIYNASGSDPATRGRLWRFDLSTRISTLIDTGFAVRNNNDHVLSFDGTMLGISDQSTGTGQSTVFTLPAGGGIPKRITANAPSYLHGWSPDGRWLTYTAGRPSKKDAKVTEWDIYKIRSDGSGEEINLTRSDGLDDGPEYSPDGRWIYFNSTRSGQMQIWRMSPDGDDQQRITHDHQYNDWFAHLSPDGKWMVMISYGLDVAASEHPYYKHCYLRIAPTDGSASPKVIAYVYGGQGTINVPSWSPDGMQVAFVSNSDVW
jgi:TolB protein